MNVIVLQAHNTHTIIKFFQTAHDLFNWSAELFFVVALQSEKRNKSADQMKKDTCCGVVE